MPNSTAFLWMAVGHFDDIISNFIDSRMKTKVFMSSSYICKEEVSTMPLNSSEEILPYL